MTAVIDPRAIDKATPETVGGGVGGEGGKNQRCKDTSNGSVNKDSVAEVPDSDPLPAPPPLTLQPQRSLPAPKRAPPRRIDHTHRDYSNFPLDELPPGKRPSTNFPSKLHQILSSQEHSHIISWMPHGRAWKVHNRELLMSEVVPKYFAQSKYESFTRQLNGWGFKRLHQSGNDFNAYYHECFLRGLPLLSVLMKRTAANLGKLLPQVEGEPNFYEIEKQFPLPLPIMPYPGHYNYPSSHMASTVLEPPYHNQNHRYAPCPSSYPVPSTYYADDYGGAPPAAMDYAPPPDPEYSSFYPYYPPAQGGGQLPAHDHYHHYPYHLYPPLADTKPYYEPPLPNNAADAEKSEEVATAPSKGSENLE